MFGDAMIGAVIVWAIFAPEHFGSHLASIKRGIDKALIAQHKGE